MQSQKMISGVFGKPISEVNSQNNSLIDNPLLTLQKMSLQHNKNKISINNNPYDQRQERSNENSTVNLMLEAGGDFKQMGSDDSPIRKQLEDFRQTLKKGKRDLSKGKSQKESIRKETSKTRLNQLKNEYA